eukprot:jgi/Chrzof1/10539/Cz05g02150.t1
MRPSFNPSHSICRNAGLRQARIAAGKKAGQAHSRATTVFAASRLVLTPTGTGACDHIGEKVSLPTPIPLNDGVFEVGRTEPADIVLKIPTVSSRHALLRVENDKVSVTDLNSTNGTVVNGQELSPMDNVEIPVGAEVVFGDVFLARFQLDEVPDDNAGRDDSQASERTA